MFQGSACNASDCHNHFTSHNFEGCRWRVLVSRWSINTTAVVPASCGYEEENKSRGLLDIGILIRQVMWRGERRFLETKRVWKKVREGAAFV